MTIYSKCVNKIMGYDKYVRTKTLLQMPWADLKRPTTTEARWNKRLKGRDWFTKIKAYNKPLSRNFRSIWAGYWLTVCNPPYIDLLDIMQTLRSCWNITLLERRYELSFSDAIVYRNDRILVSAALHAKDPDFQMKLRMWPKVQPLGLPEHLYGDQRWTSNWCSSLIHVKSATPSRLRTELQTLVKSWVWYFWLD